MKKHAINLLDFMRFSVSLSGSFIAILAYLLTNQVDSRIIFVSMGSFFLCATVYSYNNLKDKKEDVVNRKNLNPITKSKFSPIIILTFLFLSITFYYMLSYRTLLFSFLFVFSGIFYSFFKLKKYFLIKNIYIGFCAILLFLSGTINYPLNFMIMSYSLIFAIFVALGSVISDLRDYKGDKISGFKTLPVHAGYSRTKKIVYFSLLAFSCVVYLVDVMELFPIIPFIPVIIYLVYKDKPGAAHFSGGLSILVLLISLFIL